MKKRYFIAVFLVSFSLLLAGCYDNASAPSASSQEDSHPETNISSKNEPEASDKLKEFTLTAKKWTFEPSNITVNKGDIVRINIKDVDVPHGFAISEFDIDEYLEPGEDTVIEFTADKSGTFVFYCSVPCGPGHGDMNGTLIVN